MIAVLLPTRDALNLRLASRAMAWLFESTSFWRTRFDANNERGHIAMVVQDLPAEKRHKLDWRLLYHCTCNLWCSQDFYESNVQKWERIRWPRDMTVPDMSPESPLHFDGRALQHYHNSRYRHTQVVTVDTSRSLSQINVSVMQNIAFFRTHEPHRGYTDVTGMEFIYDDGRPPVTVGYSTPGAFVATEKTTIKAMPKHSGDLDYRYPGTLHVFDARPLRGFHVVWGGERNKPAKICAFGDTLCRCYRSQMERGVEIDTFPDVMHLDQVEEAVITLNVSLKSIKAPRSFG